MPSLEPLSPPSFTQRYLDYDSMTAVLTDWAASHPTLARLTSLAKTPEGRDVWLLTIGTALDEKRPIAWVDANMHASELCGTNVALAIAHAVLRFHATGESNLPAPVAEVLRDIHVCVMPRMSPDGAEAVLTQGRFIRSVPRDERPGQETARWRGQDLDGDGLALLMRVEDPTGELVESEHGMRPRSVTDEGPFYKVYPEAVIENYDGVTIPTPTYLADNDPDLNRNFPHGWAPEPKQIGAGGFPGSEPESRAVIDAALARPEIFLWLNLHTFGGVHIRPRGDVPDGKMNQESLAIYRQLEAWAEEHTGYPMVSGFEQFTYSPDTPIAGDLTAWVYHQRGAITWVCELWDFFEQIGVTHDKRFVDRYSRFDDGALERFFEWDRDHNAGRCHRPWREVTHPQLGKVEVGGLDPRFGIWNPPEDRLAEICRGQVAMFLRAAAMAPRVHVDMKTRPLGDDLAEVIVTVENRGYLGTQVLPGSGALPINADLVVSLSSDGEIEGPARVDLGHLDGYGRGLESGHGAPYILRTRGTTARRVARFLVRGGADATARVSGCRVGVYTHSLSLR